MKNRILFAFIIAVALSVSCAIAAEKGALVQAVYTSEIRDREPVDKFTVLPTDLARVYFYTELRDLAGQTVIHRWQHEGKTVFEIPFEVSAARWRVWSRKEIHPGMSGEWTVVVVDGNGRALGQATLTVAQ